MLVRCVTNSIHQVAPRAPADQDWRKWFGSSSDLLSLSTGALYTVYAVSMDHHARYFIADNDYDGPGPLCYPVSYESFFFDVIDARVSSCWTLGVQSSSSKPKCDSELLLTFKEWVSDESFYENLVDGHAHEVGIFRQYKAFMDIEFPSPGVTEKAELIEDNWLMCSKCCEAWQSDVVLGMVNCPQCSSVLLNPRYCNAPDFLDR